MSEPPFDGNPVTYIAWKENFTSVILNNARLTDEQKFSCLKRNVVGKPATQLQRYPNEGKNLIPALTMLESYYLNKDFRLNELIRRIEDTKKVTNHSVNNLIDLNTLVTEFAQYLWNTHPAKLANVNHYFEIIVVRYPNMLETIVRREADNVDTDPYYSDLVTTQQRDEVKFNIAVFELNTHTQQQNQKHQQQQLYLGNKPSGDRHRSDERNSRHNFSTVSQTTTECAFCKQSDHPTYTCTKPMAPEVRRDIVEKRTLCYCCLKPWQVDHKCSYRCLKCNSKHNTLICLTPRGNSQSRSRSTSPGRERAYQAYRQRRQTPEYRSRNSFGRHNSRGRYGRDNRPRSRSGSNPRYYSSRSGSRSSSPFRGRVQSGDRSYQSRTSSRDNRPRSYRSSTPYNNQSRQSSRDRGRPRSNSREPQRRSSSANVTFHDDKKKEAQKDKKTRERSKSPKKD